MSSSSAQVPTLIYFNVPGRGEITRLLFTLGKVAFEVSADQTFALLVTSSEATCLQQ
jgi:hypothetical protein